ncbi:MAG: glutamate 5-kinase [Planktomarina sp.]
MATLKDAKRLVVKIGSALLVDQDTGALRSDWLQSLADDVAALKARGVDVVLVSSGSIALGRSILGLGASTLTLEQSQAAAAVGQIRLAQAYQEVFAPHGITTGQVLLTLEDSENRRRYLNARATLGQLLRLGTVPIVNENDTIATDEIRYGDNDRLAAQIAVTVGADQLVLLSDIDGLYTANPKDDPTATRFDQVDAITPELEAMAGDAGTGLSKGGMKTKLMAAKMAMGAGCAMAITLGYPMHPLQALEDGANATWFAPSGDPHLARKSWISAMKPRGAVHIDAGALKALARGKSLLPAGVTQVTGDFERGDPVRIVDANGDQVGMGLARFSQIEANMIKGQHTEDFESILGYAGRASLIHRDDMVMQN